MILEVSTASSIENAPHVGSNRLSPPFDLRTMNQERPELPPLDPNTFFRVGVVFEFALVGLAAAIEWFRFGVAFPYFPTGTDAESLLTIAVGMLPLLAYVLFATSDVGLRIPALRSIYDRLEGMLGESLRELAVWQCLLISIGAGVGEEFLFRGVFQEWWGFGWTCLVFGALHALTPAYFFFAFAMSAYMGWLYDRTDDIIVPVTLHAAYDFVALVLIRRRLRRSKQEEPSDRSALPESEGSSIVED